MAGRDDKAKKVLAFPALLRVPEPEMPLSGVAREKYDEVAGALLRAKKLNSYTRNKCELLAIAHGAMHKKISMNIAISASARDEISRFMKELQLVDESESVAPTASGSENRFARIGVIVRPGTQKAELRPS